MAKSLRERARLANVGGDIIFQQRRGEQRKTAERALSKRTDEAYNLLNKKNPLGAIVDVLKFGAEFIKKSNPLYGPGLNIADMLIKNLTTKNWEKKFDKSIPKNLRGTVYEDYFKQNLSGIGEQLSQAFKSKRQANTINELLFGAMKLGSMPLFEGKGLMNVPEGFQGPPQQAIMPNQLSFLDKYLPKGGTWDKTLGASLPGYGLARFSEDENLLQYGELGLPLIQNLIRGKSQAISPAAPRYEVPSIRRRIR